MVDINAFLSQNVESPMATTFQKCPEGTFVAQISADADDMEIISGEKNDRTWHRLNLKWEILDSGVLESLKRDRVTVRQGMFLDFDDNGQLVTDDDRNVALGKLRKALGQNSGPWSPSMLIGAGPALVTVVSEPNDKDPSDPYRNVSGVNPVS